MRGDAAVVAWEGASLRLDEELTLVHCGGHFPGSAALHRARGANRPACLFAGDTINALSDGESASFMHNYPRQVPLPAAAVQGIAEAIAPFELERLYGCWPQNLIGADAKRAVMRSVERHVREHAA
jgi:hypothetical protein